MPKCRNENTTKGIKFEYHNYNLKNVCIFTQVLKVVRNRRKQKQYIITNEYSRRKMKKNEMCVVFLMIIISTMNVMGQQIPLMSLTPKYFSNVVLTKDSVQTIFLTSVRINRGGGYCPEKDVSDKVEYTITYGYTVERALASRLERDLHIADAYLVRIESDTARYKIMGYNYRVGYHIVENEKKPYINEKGELLYVQEEQEGHIDRYIPPPCEFLGYSDDKELLPAIVLEYMIKYIAENIN